MRARAAGLAATTALVLAASTVGAAVGVQRAADPEPVRASCTAKPVVRTLADGRQRIRTVCTLPPAPVETVTETVTADPTTEPPVTEPPTTGGGFPTRNTTGTPDGWEPVETLTGLTITQAGTTYEDLRVTGDVIINAPDVTLRRIDVVGGRIFNDTTTCQPGLTIEDTTVRRSSAPTSGDTPAVAVGGYTATNVLIDGLPEGFRVGGKARCGPVTIEDSYTRIVAPDRCGDWHGDGIQGYDGGALTVRNTALELVERGDCGGTAAFFYPSGQGNTSVNIDGLIVQGGGFAFRLGTPGTVAGLHVVAGSWGYGPIDVKCSALASWEASISTLDGDGQPVPVRDQPCDTNGGT